MSSQREEMEKYQLGQLFDALANNIPGGHLHESAAAELARREFVAREEVDAAQMAAAQAQIDASEYAKQSVDAMRKTVLWTAVAAVFTALSAIATLITDFHR
ncbi:hypothetical protein Msil_2171 [Methylocella silvestris BL2]|uniref:Transmembrane protein n=1 Tax=Methylocella silvestris (strain DSM 15510 / CIP 108128 / LMG 27833 / NCIMB 13906 / BL2) TaxID=395965 RepID=B8ESX1_METSB|nr:hypothetical protein [Methylocella silvestris]ACK51109.1 hypothetical protein Msil_2171 [Methylocella silvestris BL2]